jgi:ferredoxin
MDGQQQSQTENPGQDAKTKNKQYTLQHDRPNCIGCAACEAVAPDFWEMNSDGKSDIKKGKNIDNGWQELDFEDKDLSLNKDAADSCPVNVIHIVKKDTGEKII